jgi:hypothetical protein
MPYNADLTVIKQILRITDTTSDAELTACQASGYAEVNNILKWNGFSVPLSSVDQNVKDAENYFACAYFREREDSVEAEKLHIRGKAFLQAYIDGESGKCIFKAVQA